MFSFVKTVFLCLLLLAVITNVNAESEVDLGEIFRSLLSEITASPTRTPTGKQPTPTKGYVTMISKVGGPIVTLAPTGVDGITTKFGSSMVTIVTASPTPSPDTGDDEDDTGDADDDTEDGADDTSADSEDAEGDADEDGDDSDDSADSEDSGDGGDDDSKGKGDSSSDDDSDDDKPTSTSSGAKPSSTADSGDSDDSEDGETTVDDDSKSSSASGTSSSSEPSESTGSKDNAAVSLKGVTFSSSIGISLATVTMGVFLGAWCC